MVMWLLALALLGLTGCSSTNISELMKAIAADQNAYCFRGQLGTVYGTTSQMIGRGSMNTSVEVTSEKCTITGSGMTTVTVPVPNISVQPVKPAP